KRILRSNERGKLLQNLRIRLPEESWRPVLPARRERLLTCLAHERVLIVLNLTRSARLRLARIWTILARLTGLCIRPLAVLVRVLRVLIRNLLAGRPLLLERLLQQLKLRRRELLRRLSRRLLPKAGDACEPLSPRRTRCQGSIEIGRRLARPRRQWRSTDLDHHPVLGMQIGQLLLKQLLALALQPQALRLEILDLRLPSAQRIARGLTPSKRTAAHSELLQEL